jgi:hypothetical protein
VSHGGATRHSVVHARAGALCVEGGGGAVIWAECSLGTT